VSAEENKAIVQRYYDEISNAKKLEHLDELLAPDYRGNLAPGQTEGGLDREATRTVWAGLWEAFPDWTQTVHDIIAAGDRVVVSSTTRGTHKGTYECFGLQATGRQVECTEIAIYRVADGRIVEHRSILDFLSLLHQLGVIPSFEELQDSGRGTVAVRRKG
jgi:predicted ester cyclase